MRFRVLQEVVGPTQGIAPAVQHLPSRLPTYVSISRPQSHMVWLSSRLEGRSPIQVIEVQAWALCACQLW
jgi:hypothetical protein